MKLDVPDEVLMLRRCAKEMAQAGQNFDRCIDDINPHKHPTAQAIYKHAIGQMALGVALTAGFEAVAMALHRQQEPEP